MKEVITTCAMKPVECAFSVIYYSNLLFAVIIPLSPTFIVSQLLLDPPIKHHLPDRLNALLNRHPCILYLAISIHSHSHTQ